MKEKREYTELSIHQQRKLGIQKYLSWIQISCLVSIHLNKFLNVYYVEK
jgi:hypothetical protein